MSSPNGPRNGRSDCNVVATRPGLGCDGHHFDSRIWRHSHGSLLSPGSADSSIEVKSRYDHFIGGQWVAPAKGGYFENISPVNGKPFTEIGRGTAEDIEAALMPRMPQHRHGAGPLTRSAPIS